MNLLFEIYVTIRKLKVDIVLPEVLPKKGKNI